MSDLVIKNVLDAIHYVLERNEFDFNEKQLEKADNEIIPYIEELDIDEKEFKIIQHGSPVLSYDKRIDSVLIRYFAIIENNTSLYNSLIEEGYDFKKKHNGFKFYALDRILTLHMKNNEYIKLLMKHDEVVDKFYSSLRGLDRKEKEEYCIKFIDIIHRDASVMKIGYDKEDNNNYNYLTKRNIELFGSDFLVNTNSNQRNIINCLYFHMNEEDASIIKELLTKYPECKLNIFIDKDVLHNFTIDEIVNISLKDAKLYETAMKACVLDRMKELLKLKPDFDCPLSFIREGIFRVLDNDTILGLTEEGIKDISKIVIPEIDNVVVMPVKKIRKIVFMDNLRKIKEEKFGSHKR